MLGDLRAAIAAGDWTRAVELALAAWRSTRAPALADLVDVVGARCPVPEAAHGTHLHGWWMERALRYAPANATQLLDKLSVHATGVAWEAMRARLFDGNPLIRALRAGLGDNVLRDDCGIYDRLAAILAWPDDPRVARCLADFIVAPPLEHVGVAAPIAMRIAGERFAALGDTRALEQLRLCVREPRARSPRMRAAQVIGAMAAVNELVATPGTSDELAAAIADCRALLGAPPPAPAPRTDPAHVDALWAAVAADPTDLGARMVLGDALVELGEARGQLIAIQCNHRSGALRGDDRPRALIRREWKKWLGDLALVIVRRGSEWRNGMLERVTVGKHDAPDWAYGKSRGHREMIAVDSVTASHCPGPLVATFLVGLPRDPRRLALRGPEVFRELAARRGRLATRSLVYEVTWDYSTRPDETFQRIADAVPMLEELELSTPAYALPVTPLAFPRLPALFPALAKLRISQTAVESVRTDRSLYAWLRGSPIVEVLDA